MTWNGSGLPERGVDDDRWEIPEDEKGLDDYPWTEEEQSILNELEQRGGWFSSYAGGGFIDLVGLRSLHPYEKLRRGYFHDLKLYIEDFRRLQPKA